MIPDIITQILLSRSHDIVRRHTTNLPTPGYYLHTGRMKILSPQQTVSCDDSDLGCNGGDTITAYEYMREAGGIELEADYPYKSGVTERTGTCKADPSDYKVKVGQSQTISDGASGESDM